MHFLSVILGGMSAALALTSAICWIKAARVTMPTLTFQVDGARPHEVEAAKVQGFGIGWRLGSGAGQRFCKRLCYCSL